MDSILANRRRHPRIPIDSTIRIHIGGKDFFPLKVSNVSMGGMCIYVQQELLKGQKGKLWFTRQVGMESITFDTQFKIQWVDSAQPGSSEFLVGLEFFKMKRKHQDSLLRLLRIQGSMAGQ